MTGEPTPEPLPHLAIDREPDLAYRRRPPQAFGSSSSRSDRAHHAGDTGRLADQAKSEISATRTQSGIDPSRLLVLEFTTVDRTAREEIESRLNATVVDERIQQRGVTSHLVRSADFDEGSLPSGARVRRAQVGDIAASHKASAAQISKDLDPKEHVVVEVPPESTLGVSASLASWTKDKELLRVTVQFDTVGEVERFRREIDAYGRGEKATTVMPEVTRQKFFDAIEWIGTQSREDRTGHRLAEEGVPSQPEFALDVDLWHPGTEDGARHISNQLRALCTKHGGRVQDEMRTQSLVLARVSGNAKLLDILLGLDIVALVNLPPKLDKAHETLFDDAVGAAHIPVPTGDEPKVAIIDSGVLSGHPLLAGWVLDERDFGTTENTPSDLQGHGTQVAGLALYGDVGACLREQQWTPAVQILNGKVLEKDVWGEPSFPEGCRPERMVEEAIRYFHQHHGCRVFNLSLGARGEVYRSGGRQFAWAHVLDSLAKELDIVIVVSAGNTSPREPNGASQTAVQEAVRDGLLADESHRLVNPATAALALTVGATASSVTLFKAPALVGAPIGAPAPFSRSGPGYEAKPSQRAVKPEFAAPGGNVAWRTFAGQGQWSSDLHLGEPTTRLPQDGRFVTAVSGTSFAAPKIAHVAARALHIAQDILGSPPTANTVRAMLGAASVDPPCGRDWLLDSSGAEAWEKLRLVGYGNISMERVMASSSHDVVLLAEDKLTLDHWHIYRVPVPSDFLERKGLRGLNVALALDPPVRASRKEYVATTMWFEVLKGLSHADIVKFKAALEQQKDAAGKKIPLPSMPNSHELDMRPTKEPLQWSTLQVRKKTWSRKVDLPIQDGESSPVLHILVGSQSRFPTGLEDVQSYSLAIRFWHKDPSVEVYQHLSSNVRLRPRSRARIQARG